LRLDRGEGTGRRSGNHQKANANKLSQM
jgi:hypothetical protein